MTFVEQYEARPFMIRHFVFFSAQSSQLDVVFEGLKILEKIPHADLVEVWLNEKLDKNSKEVDVVIYAEFSSGEASNPFKSDLCTKSRVNVCDPIVTPICRRHTSSSDYYSTVIHTGQWSDGFSIARNV